MKKEYPKLVYVKGNTSAQLYRVMLDFSQEFREYIFLFTPERIKLKCGTTIIFIHEFRDGMDHKSRIIHADDFLELCYRHYSGELQKKVEEMSDKLINLKIFAVFMIVYYIILLLLFHYYS